MIIPDFSKPDNYCFLTIDKNGNKIKNGDTLISNNIPLFGSKPTKKEFPVTSYDGKLISIIKPSFMLSFYAETFCEIKGI